MRDGYSKSFKVIKIGANRKPIYDFLLVFRCNYMPVLYRFRDTTIYCSKMSFSLFLLIVDNGGSDKKPIYDCTFPPVSVAFHAYDYDFNSKSELAARGLLMQMALNHAKTRCVDDGSFQLAEQYTRNIYCDRVIENVLNSRLCYCLLHLNSKRTLYKYNVQSAFQLR